MSKTVFLKNFSDLKKKLLTGKNAVFSGGILLLVAAGVIAGCTKTAASSQTAEVTPVMKSNTVIAEGHLVPISSTWLSFQTAGRIEQILVNEGSAVKKDQPLIVLEGSDRALANLTSAQSANFLAQQNLSDAKKSDVAKSSAELALAKAKQAYDNALSDYWNLDDTNGSEEQISLFKAKVVMAQDKVEKLEKRLKKMAELDDDDPAKAAVQAQLEQARIDLQNLQDLLDYYKDTPDANDIAVTEDRKSVV